MKFLRPISLKLAIFIPITIGIVLAIIFSTVSHINSSVNTLHRQLENSLTLQVKTIMHMFARERNMKLEDMQANLRVAHGLFFSRPLTIRQGKEKVPVVNQVTSDTVIAILDDWYWGSHRVNNSTLIVDTIRQMVGGTVTIFQKTSQGYVRISTNVLKEDGTRATGTFIPVESTVIQTVQNGQTFTGRAFVVNEWYITAYEPIMHHGEVVGMLYVGVREKDLEGLRKVLYELKIGKSGYPFVFDENGIMIMHPSAQGENWSNRDFIRRIIGTGSGVLGFHSEEENEDKIVAYQFNNDFRLYVAAIISPRAETRALVRKNIISSSLVGTIIIIIYSVFVYFITTERVRGFVNQIEISKQNLSSAREELKQSEDRFRTIFNSTTDNILMIDLQGNILEANEAACQDLGYSREELQRMDIIDIKSERYKKLVFDHRRRVIEEGRLTYESEHMSRQGVMIPMEMNSRLIEYRDEKFILIVARNISERREVERKILSAVIQAEEKERERFSKDMHDGLGPLLSTIKLYVNELASEDLKSEEKDSYVKYTNELVDEAIASARNISNNLMPRIILDYGLVTAVDAFCKRVNQANQVKISFTARHMDQVFDHNTELILFRVITEMINNTIKHASATQARLVLERKGNTTHLEYHDNGKGFDTGAAMLNQEGGMGLKNIVSRIKSINGVVKIESNPEQGSSFYIEI